MCLAASASLPTAGGASFRHNYLNSSLIRNKTLCLFLPDWPSSGEERTEQLGRVYRGSPRLASPGLATVLGCLHWRLLYHTKREETGQEAVGRLTKTRKFTKSFVSAINYWNILILYPFLIFCFLQRNYIKTKKFSREQHHLTICLKRISIFWGLFWGYEASLKRCWWLLTGRGVSEVTVPFATSQQAKLWLLDQRAEQKK